MKNPTKSQILEASEKCGDAKEILEVLYPEAFGRREVVATWVDVTDECKLVWKHSIHSGYKFAVITHRDWRVSHIIVLDNRGLKMVEDAKARYKFELSDDGEDFRIYKKQ